MPAIARLLALLLLALAACIPTPTAPTPQGFVPENRLAPTPTPPPWLEGAAALTLENVSRITRLGRLDAATTPSTVFAYAFSPDGTRLAGLNNDQIILWDLLTGQIVWNTARGEALRIDFAPDKSQVYVVTRTGDIGIFDADSGQLLDTLRGHPQYNGVAAYHADLGLLALGGDSGEVKVWDVAARQSLVTFRAQQFQVTTLAFAPDGARLASGGGESAVGVWDWRARSQTLSLQAAATRLAFSPDGRLLAVGENARIRLWSLADDRSITLETGAGGARDVLLFSPDGRFLVNGGAIPALTVWDTATGGFITALPGMGGDSTYAAFSPDGALLVTTALGAGVALWNMTQMDSEQLARADLDMGTRQVLMADWSPDGFVLAAFEAAGPVQIWGIPAAE